MSDLQERIQVLVDGLVESGTEDGAQVAVYRHGESIVNVTAGLADADRPVTPDTLFYAASTGKGVTATVAHVLVQKGVLGYDTPIVEVWPEFGAHGKETATLRHVLTHSAGVPAVSADTTIEALCDWDGMCTAIAGSTPWWAPGERVGYHALTFGYLVGEIVRRATGKPISQVLAEEVARPLGIERELYFGVPAAERSRIAHLTDDRTGTAVFATLPADFPLFQTAPRAIFPNAAYGNRADIRGSNIPASGIFSARAIARMYAAVLGTVDGVRLIEPERLAEISTLATDGQLDEMTGAPASYALGYTVGWPGTSAPHEHPSLFGMVGIGLGGAYADTATGLSIAVTRNRFNPIDLNLTERVFELVLKDA